MIESDIIYAEQRSTGRVAAAIGVIAIVLVAIDLATGFALKGWGILASVFLLIVAGTLWGISRYNSIRLTADRLVVGRISLAADDLDRTFGVQAADTLENRERTRIELPFPILKRSPVQVLGGGWGRNAGSGLLVVRRTGSDKKSAIVTRHPDQLGPLLGRWLQP